MIIAGPCSCWFFNHRGHPQEEAQGLRDWPMTDVKTGCSSDVTNPHRKRVNDLMARRKWEWEAVVTCSFLLLRWAVTMLIGKMELLWILLLLFRWGETILGVTNTWAHVAFDAMIHFLEIWHSEKTPELLCWSGVEQWLTIKIDSKIRSWCRCRFHSIPAKPQVHCYVESLSARAGWHGDSIG